MKTITIHMTDLEAEELAGQNHGFRQILVRELTRCQTAIVEAKKTLPSEFPVPSEPPVPANLSSTILNK